LSDKDIEELSKRPVSKETGLKTQPFNKKDIVFEDGDLFIVNKAS